MQPTASREPFHILYDWYRQMRANQPIFRDPESQVWHIFRYADVSRVLNDYVTFSSEPAHSNSEARSHNPLRNPIESTMIQMDPPRHHQLRGLVSQVFFPRMVAQLEPRIAAITNELLDQVASRGEMDVVRALDTPLPVTVIAELLGIPASLHEDFKRWSDAVLASHEETTETEKQVLFQESESMFLARPIAMRLSSLMPTGSLSSGTPIVMWLSGAAFTSVWAPHWHDWRPPSRLPLCSTACQGRGMSLPLRWRSSGVQACLV